MFCRKDPVGFSETKDDVYSIEISDETYTKLIMANRRGCILRSGADGMPEAISEFGNGIVIDLATVTEDSSFVPSVTLANQATYALSKARNYVNNYYTMLNEATPDDWVTYLKALMAIEKGSDTASTKLPEPPAT